MHRHSTFLVRLDNCTGFICGGRAPALDVTNWVWCCRVSFMAWQLCSIQYAWKPLAGNVRYLVGRSSGVFPIFCQILTRTLCMCSDPQMQSCSMRSSSRILMPQFASKQSNSFSVSRYRFQPAPLHGSMLFYVYFHTKLSTLQFRSILCL